MKNIVIKEEFNKIFQIVGEDLNISNNFTYDDYLKLDYDTKEMFDDELDYKFNEKRGIFRTDFQIALDKINKKLKKESIIENNINDIDSLLSIKNYAINSKNEKAKKEKKTKKNISIFERIKNSIDNTSSESKDSKENNEFDTIYPDIFNIKEEDEESMDVIYPEIFDFDENDNHEEESVNYVPEVPVFKKPKKEETEIMVPDSFELEENKENDKLSKQIEETKKSLQQIKDNIGELHQKNNTIIEEMNLLNQDIIEQEETINQELNDKDNEFDNIISDEETVDLIKDNEEKLPTGSFNDNDIVETEFIDNNPKDDLENQINKDYKPKHLKREDKPSKDETKQKIEEDIKSCERMIEILSYKTILNESDEQKEYVKDKIKLYKNKLRNLRRQHKKYEIQSYDIQFMERRKKLESKLDKIEKNDANKQIISDIEIAISQIDSYMKYSDAYKNGFISEDELNNKGNNTYMIVDYVMNERQKRTRK